MGATALVVCLLVLMGPAEQSTSDLASREWLPDSGAPAQASRQERTAGITAAADPRSEEIRLKVVDGRTLTLEGKEVPIAGAAVFVLRSRSHVEVGRSDADGIARVQLAADVSRVMQMSFLVRAKDYIPAVRSYRRSSEKAPWETVQGDVPPFLVPLEKASPGLVVDFVTPPDRLVVEPRDLSYQLKLLVGAQGRRAWHSPYQSHAMLDQVLQGGTVLRESLPLPFYRPFPQGMMSNDPMSPVPAAPTAGPFAITIIGRHLSEHGLAVGTIAAVGVPGDAITELGEVPLFGITASFRIRRTGVSGPIPVDDFKGNFSIDMFQNRNWFVFSLGRIEPTGDTAKLITSPGRHVDLGTAGHPVTIFRPDGFQVELDGDPRFKSWSGFFPTRDVADLVQLRPLQAAAPASASYRIQPRPGEGCFELEAEIELSPNLPTRAAAYDLEATLASGAELRVVAVTKQGWKEIEMAPREQSSGASAMVTWTTRAPFEVAVDHCVIIADAVHDGRWMSWCTAVDNVHGRKLIVDPGLAHGYDIELQSDSGGALPDLQVYRRMEWEGDAAYPMARTGFRTHGRSRFTIPATPPATELFFEPIGGAQQGLTVKSPAIGRASVLKWSH